MAPTIQADNRPGPAGIISENDQHGRTAAAQYRVTRDLSLRLAAPLTAEDQVVQSMDDVSPTKWHLAHTTWFFETFILKPHAPDYREFDPAYNYLFNSYYNAIGNRHPRTQRGLLSRPPLEDIHGYRAHVDEAMGKILDRAATAATIAPLVTLGIHHEQQHQELLLTDIKHVFSCNQLKPAYWDGQAPATQASPAQWIDCEGGLVEIGVVEQNTGFERFAFDNEGPVHKIWLEPYRLADRLVTNGEYLEFIEDDGYRQPEHWLSDGWDTIAREDWTAPLYWEQRDGEWTIFTLMGERPLNPCEPVSHLSFYEADAYARWAGARLPGEAEWEAAMRDHPVEGNMLPEGHFHPVPVNGVARGTGPFHQAFGDVWEWTQSAYRPYPGFRPGAGAIGEYNGKFMNNQMVLKGGSCVTPGGHTRATYRNFFYPHQRWQFTGLRLAQDL